MFVEDKSAEKIFREAGKESPDVTHVRLVKSGDTLPLLCLEIYGSSAYYLRVAADNGLDDFRNLVPGQRLYFAPLDGERCPEWLNDIRGTDHERRHRDDPERRRVDRPGLRAAVDRHPPRSESHSLSASLLLADGDAAEGSVPPQQWAVFPAGEADRDQAALRIGRPRTPPLFKGPVVRHAVEANRQGSVLRVEMKDAAVKLTQARKSMVFRDQTDDRGDAQADRRTQA